jgi:heme exporter protein C
VPRLRRGGRSSAAPLQVVESHQPQKHWDMQNRRVHEPRVAGSAGEWLLERRFGVLKSALRAIVLFVLIAATAYLAFYYAPVEKSMGVIQKIFYIHVSSALTSFIAFGICFYANLRYVFTRQPKSDWLGVSAAEVGLAFITVVLITGPIWAKPVWGIWWTWDARLTLTFVLGLLYLSYLLLRSMIEEPDKRALFSALFGIFAFLDVPLVYFSIRWWRTQHPQPVILGGPGSGLEPRMRVSYLLMWGALTGLLILLLGARYKLEALRANVEDLRREAEVQ